MSARLSGEEPKMTYLHQGTEYLTDTEWTVYQAVKALNADHRTTNNSQLASMTHLSRATVADVTAHLRRRSYLKDTYQGAAYHWKTTGKPAQRRERSA